jgi:Ca2+-binding EF-hand superfamily protein
MTLLAPFAVDAPLQDAQVRTAITGAIGLLSCANTMVVTSSTTAQKADTAIAVQVEVTDADESRLQYMQDAAMLKAAINQGLSGDQQITAVQGVSWAVAPGPDPSPSPDTTIDTSSSTSENSETQGSGQSGDDSSTTMGIGVAAGGAGLVALVFVANNMRKKQKLRVKPTALKMARTSAISSTSDGPDHMRRSSSGKGSFSRRRPSVQAYPVDTMHMLRDDDGTRRSFTGKLSDMEAGDDQGAARQMSFMSDSDNSDMAMDDILVPEHQPPELSHMMTGPSMRSLGRTLQVVPAAPEESYDTWATSEAPVPAGVPDLEFMAAPARVPNANPRKKVQLPKVKNFTLALAPSVEKAVADQTNKVFAELDQEVDGYILDRALASYLHISPAEAAHIITEAKIALHGRRDNGKLTRDEFSAVLRLAADHYLDRDSFTPLQEMPQRAVRHYRRIFEDIDEKGRGVITLQQLAMGMPGMDDVVSGLASSRGSQGILTFEQFANVLHRAERGGAGRAMAQLLEETPEGRALVNAVRSQQETTDTASAKAQPVDPTTVPPLVMDMWMSANPDPRTGVADVDQLRDALVMANTSGDLMCTEQELVHLVGTLSLRSESGQVDFDGFWRTLEPLVEVVQEGLAISQSGMQSSIMASSIMSSNDYMPGYHADDLYCRDVFSSLVGRVDIEDARIGSRDLMSKIHNVLNSAKMGTDRVFYFHLTNLVSTAPLDDLDYRMFASLVKDAETATMVDVDDEWDPADAMRLLM